MTEDYSTSNDGEHTSSNPYCSDMSCWCHTNLDYHADVTEFDEETVDTDEYETALSFLLAS
jgi:hypothetical protein